MTATHWTYRWRGESHTREFLFSTPVTRFHAAHIVAVREAAPHGVGSARYQRKRKRLTCLVPVNPNAE